MDQKFIKWKAFYGFIYRKSENENLKVQRNHKIPQLFLRRLSILIFMKLKVLLTLLFV
jgi:hypothetical protein